MNMDNINMTPSEKLNMLLDGETAGVDPTDVFYELSNNPELQQEFMDILKMRQLMSEVPAAPPERLKRGIMAGIGLGGSGLWYYLQNSGIVAATTAFVSSKVGTALLAGMFGVLATFMFMENDNNNEKSVNETNAIETSNFIPIEMEIPTVSSISKESQDNTSNSNASYSDVSRSVVTNIDEESKRSLDILESAPIAYNEEIEGAIFNNSSEITYNQLSISDNNNERSGFIINPTNRISQDVDYERLMLFSLQAKGIANNSFTEADMSTTEAPAINNIGIALMYSVNDDFALGLEFGQEFFVQKVTADGIDNGGTLSENQLTFWGGLKASYTFNEAPIINNLRPTTAILIGGTSRGWVSKASAGLVYDISNKLSVYGGPEWTTGVYNFDSNLLSTHKWGFYYGMALKF